MEACKCALFKLEYRGENNVIQAHLSTTGKGVSQISLHTLYALCKLKFYVKLGLEEGHVSRDISLSNDVRFVGFALERPVRQSCKKVSGRFTEQRIHLRCQFVLLLTTMCYWYIGRKYCLVQGQEHITSLLIQIKLYDCYNKNASSKCEIECFNRTTIE